MAKRLTPPDVSKPYNPPRLPASPIKASVAARARQDRPNIDRPDLRGVAEGMSPRELSTLTRGPLVSERETLRQHSKEFDRDRQTRQFTRDYSKRPLQLKGRSLGGRR